MHPAPPQASASPPPLSAGKRRAFRLVTFAILIVFAAGAAEFSLRWQQRRVAASDALEPGMIHPDARLGWALTPYWNGQHRHHDFAARYTINSLGFRADTPFDGATPAHPLTAVVGDSFTFGLGVNDTDTFVHRLNASAPGGQAFVNCAVPGYSTDQEALLIEGQVLALRPRRIILLVYLGNDLLDNPRAAPLQVRSPKPFFALTPSGLELRNSPVPLGPAPVADAGGLTAAILGTDSAQWPWRVRWEQRSEVFGLLSPAVLPAIGAIEGREARFAPAVELFRLLLERIRLACAGAKVELLVGTLAGRSYVEQPGSLSAHYQEYFRVEVLRIAQAQGLPVVDLAAQMGAAGPSFAGPRFFPHDGHLTPVGHRLVAELLLRNLSRRN